MAAPTNAEQYMLELVNRARLDPLAEAARWGLADLNKDLPANQQITPGVKQVLAFNLLLNDAADTHSQYMVNTDYWGHEGDGTHGSRMQAAGYNYTSPYYDENISWYAGSSAFNDAASIDAQHKGLFLSAQHREAILNGNFREIGIGQKLGAFEDPDTNVFKVWDFSSLITQNFGTIASQARFITGVVYNDTSGDHFYTAGEGLGGVTVSVAGAGSMATWGSGGYSIANAPAGTATVTFSGGGLAGAVSAQVQVSANNVKVDLISKTEIASSASTTLGDGALNLTLLGDAANATGNGASNKLVGDNYDNRLTGLAGDDTIDGGAGTDTAAFSNTRADYRVTKLDDGSIKVAAIAGKSADGTDTVKNVEKFAFSDQTIALADLKFDTGVVTPPQTTAHGFDDPVFQSDKSGTVFIAHMDGGAFQGWQQGAGAIGTVWHAVGTGDVNWEGGSELFVQNASNGSIWYASLDTGSTTWGSVAGAIGTQWQLRAVADVNGDGAADALVQNTSNGTIYFADAAGGTFQGWGLVTSSINNAWKLAGAGDINGDGFADIVVQNQTNGTTYYADMNGGEFSGWNAVSTNLTSDWKVVGVADASGDGFADVLIQHQSTGTTYYADMANGAFDHWVNVASNINSKWQVQATNDVDHDGHVDVLFQHADSGATYYAHMGDNGFTGWGVVANNITNEWDVV